MGREIGVTSCNNTFLVAAHPQAYYMASRDPYSGPGQADINASLTRRTLIFPARFSTCARS